MTADGTAPPSSRSAADQDIDALLPALRRLTEEQAAPLRARAVR